MCLLALHYYGIEAAGTKDRGAGAYTSTNWNPHVYSNKCSLMYIALYIAHMKQPTTRVSGGFLEGTCACQTSGCKLGPMRLQCCILHKEQSRKTRIRA